MEIIYLEEVEFDLQDGRAFYDRQQRGIGDYFIVSVSHTAYTDPAVDRYASGCPNDDPPNNGALC